MFAIMYDENRVIKIDCANKYEFENYEHVQTFSEGKAELINYWDNLKDDAVRNIKEAKKLKEG